MPQIEISIGGRSFEVACQEGEEHYLQSAAAMLDTEAGHLSSQIGRMPEARMLLMAGLMLADKTAGLEDKVKQADTRMAQLQAQIDTLEARPADRVEVPVVPTEVTEAMAEVAARAEALADQLENSQST
ncbi:MAG: cell division protein ZapA [Yoonia sp.]|jgi:cell division protein ZapA|nr:cell division protein ZapA [Yoonia sp.]MDG1520438.1 cell division protein ZapA [Yoonia sp.]MDG1769879.1 cell division protein ZapA [Yoonia sp.]MDG1866923.1 cell division protein ZapA [Yoonia sp.]